MKAKQIAKKYVYGTHDALTDRQEIVDMTLDIEKYADQKAELLLKACKEFVRKVDCGEARSKRSYAEMKEAIKKFEQQ